MDLMAFLIFIPACFALNMSPGPNNLLSMSNAKRYGLKVAVAAGLGRLTAFAGMIMLAASGLAVILYTSEKIFFVVKVAGACYLFWLAYKLWTADTSAEDEQISADSKGIFSLARQEFLLAAGNPKAILIFTAFLPQFINPAQQIGLQFFILGGAFLILEWIAIAAYGCFGVYLRKWFAAPGKRKLFNRGCSAMLASAGVGLLVARRG
ncbi:LysE family translocator [Aliamphritea hakodatensis]|uniref:LysE family translocator n=1 Tax=Aliamphritea hakodatensis TaxID=2895352 RepID=UPI0022FDA2B0|nr:LysE family translocator [Aliamphritea hakodatensis]